MESAAATTHDASQVLQATKGQLVEERTSASDASQWQAALEAMRARCVWKPTGHREPQVTTVAVVEAEQVEEMKMTKKVLELSWRPLSVQMVPRMMAESKTEAVAEATMTAVMLAVDSEYETVDETKPSSPNWSDDALAAAPTGAADPSDARLRPTRRRRQTRLADEPARHPSTVTQQSDLRKSTESRVWHGEWQKRTRAMAT